MRGAILVILLAGCGGGGGTALDTLLRLVPLEPAYAGFSGVFAFTANKDGATFEARLDGGPFVAVTSPYITEGLGQGSHTFEVRAIRGVDVDVTPARHAWEVGPPLDTAIVRRPPTRTLATEAVFEFTSPVADATFAVTFNGIDLGSGINPFTFRDLPLGEHTIDVLAVAPNGTRGLTPATHTWRVERSDVRVDFPPPASATNASRITVRGTTDATLGITAVRVGGTIATSSDGFRTWSIEAPLSLGRNSLPITVDDAEGGVLSEDGVVIDNRGPYLRTPVGVVHDAVRNELIVADANREALMTVDLDTGRRAVFNTDWTGIVHAGAPFANDPLAIDPGNDRVFVLHRSGGLSAVDLATGAHTLLFSTQTMRDWGLWLPNGIDYDPVGDRVFISDIADIAVHEINLSTASHRSVIGGAAFADPTDLVWDGVRGRVLVADDSAHKVFAVDVATGAQSEFGGVLFPQVLSIDASTDRLVVKDTGNIYFNTFDLATGDRDTTVVDIGLPGSANWFGGMVAVDGFAVEVHPVFNGVYAVELTGETLGATRVSVDSVGSGPELGGQEHTGATDAAFDARRDRSLLALRVARGVLLDYAVFAVDVKSGRRSVVSSTAAYSDEFDGVILPRGTGYAWSSAKDIVVDSARDKYLVLDEWGAALVEVDPATGDRARLAHDPAGTRWNHMAFDAARDEVVVLADGPKFQRIDRVTGAIADINVPVPPTVRDIAFVTGDPQLYFAGQTALFTLDLTTGVETKLVDLPTRPVMIKVDGLRIVVMTETAMLAFDLISRSLTKLSNDDGELGDFPLAPRAFCVDAGRDTINIAPYGGAADVRGLHVLDPRSGACVIASKE